MRRYTIGRSDTNDIVIAHVSVSRQHAELLAGDDGRLVLNDLGSSFGTAALIGGTWVAADNLAIEPRTALRFGEQETTAEALLVSVGADVASPGPAQEAPPPQPPAAQLERHEAPPREPEAPAAEPPPRPMRPHIRRRHVPGAGRRRAIAIGIAGAAGFGLVAAAAVAAILTYGTTNPQPPRELPNATEAAQRRFLDACTKQWGVAEPRCRCFLTAAGPNLETGDYDDYAALIEAYVGGQVERQETVIREAVAKRGAAAGARLGAAFKLVGRDCAQ